MPVQTPHKEYTNMESKWEKCRDTRDGGDAVKAKRNKYLPALGTQEQHIKEYEGYLMRALFFGATGRTVEGLAGAILQKSPSVEFPTTLKPMLDDATLGNVSFESLTAITVKEVLTVGRVGVLVDMPSGGALQPRPYAGIYDAEDIISWKTQRIDGDETLIRVVLREGTETEDQKDPFVMKAGTRYRVLELELGEKGEKIYTQTIWTPKEGKSEEYEKGVPMSMERNGKPLEFIPFVFIGSTSITPEVDKPPLDALVDANLSHYRNSADYQHGLHYTGIPVLYVAGLVDKNTGPLEFGSSRALVLEKDGSAGVIQADGKLLGALENAMDRTQKLMMTLGARLLEEQATTQETATAVGMRHSGEQATLRTIARAAEQGLTRVLQWLEWWSGTEAKPSDTKASVELNKDFFALRLKAQDIQALVFAWQAEAIVYETLYENLARGNVAREGVTAEEEQAGIKRSGGLAPVGDDV